VVKEYDDALKRFSQLECNGHGHKTSYNKVDWLTSSQKVWAMFNNSKEPLTTMRMYENTVEWCQKLIKLQLNTPRSHSKTDLIRPRLVTISACESLTVWPSRLKNVPVMHRLPAAFHSHTQHGNVMLTMLY